MQSLEEIFNEIDAKTINLDKNNIKYRDPTPIPFNRNAIKHKAYKYKKSKKRVKIFLYLSQTKNEVTVQLNTGKEIANQNKDGNPKKPIKDENHLIDNKTPHTGVNGEISITPDEFENGKYNYEDNMYLIKQCFELLK